jgi:type II secretion system-associated lipoprotein
MIKQKFGSFLLIAALLLSGCSTFIPDEDSEQISLKYQAGEYVLLQDLNRNNVIIPKNTALKLIVLTSDDWIKVYAYNSSEEILASNRFLLLYLFQEDFPEEKFSQEYLDAELLKIVKPRNSSVQPKTEKTKSLKKQK